MKNVKIVTSDPGDEQEHVVTKENNEYVMTEEMLKNLIVSILAVLSVFLMIAFSVITVKYTQLQNENIKLRNEKIQLYEKIETLNVTLDNYQRIN